MNNLSSGFFSIITHNYTVWEVDRISSGKHSSLEHMPRSSQLLSLQLLPSNNLCDLIVLSVPSFLMVNNENTNSATLFERINQITIELFNIIIISTNSTHLAGIFIIICLGWAKMDPGVVSSPLVPHVLKILRVYSEYWRFHDPWSRPPGPSPSPYLDWESLLPSHLADN